MRWQDCGYTPEQITELEAAGYKRQSTRTQGGWLVYYSHAETWDTTPIVFEPDPEEPDPEEDFWFQD